MYEQMKKKVSLIESQLEDTKLKQMFHNCFYNTLDTTITYLENNDVYMVTGDIPAMWLRDSSSSVVQYIDFAKEDEDIKKMIVGLLNRQYFYINIDPYANSFNREPNYNGFKEDEGLRTPYTWERKFEIDSLCYPIWLTYKLYEVTKDKAIINKEFVKTCSTIINVFEIEQSHHKKSEYYHYRPNELEEFCIPNHGKGGEVKENGLIWSGYRPSDDACKYGYFIPGNMFAVVILKYMQELLLIVDEKELEKKAKAIKERIEKGLKECGTIKHPKYGDIYVYETDGLGNYLLMDDANVPSLLSLPFIGYCSVEDEIYKNTRNFILSYDNPFYFSGKYLSGIGSPHTPKDYVWHIGITLQALTSTNKEEIIKCINMVKNSDANCFYTHEGIDINNPNIFTREWFAWSNSLYSFLILKKLHLLKKG